MYIKCNTSATSKAGKGQWWNFELCKTKTTTTVKFWTACWVAISYSMVLDVSYYLILLSEVECCLCFVCWEVEWSPAQVERSCVGEERCWCSRDWSCSAEHQPCVRDCWVPWDRWEVETEQHSEREDWSQQLVWEVHDDIHQENFQVLLSRTHPHPCTKLFFKIIPIKSKVFVKSWNNFSSDMIVFFLSRSHVRKFKKEMLLDLN